MADIQPGYLLKVTTWENDGDNYNTVDIDGLTEAEVRFYIHVCKLFDLDNEASIANEDIYGDEFFNIVKDHIALYPEIPENWNYTNQPHDWFYQDLLRKIGITSTEYGYWRVFENAEVFYVSEVIKDVSRNF